MTKATVQKAFVRSLPVMAGYVVLGIGFGILLERAGYGALWALFMSLFVYTGALQYVGVSLIAAGASYLTCFVTSVMLSARHLFYGISMIGRYRGAGSKKPYLIFALTDETYSLLCTEEADDGPERFSYYLLLSAFNQCYWVAGSLIGSLLGSVLPFDTTGIEFSMTALFVTVFIDQWRSAADHKSALTGILASVLCLLLFGESRFLIPAMLLIALVLTLLRPRIETGEKTEDQNV